MIRKKKIKISGQEIEVDAFGTSVVPGSGKEEASIESLLREEEIEEEVKKSMQKISQVAEEYANKEKDIWFYYKIGKILQFVDEKDFQKEKSQIWERIAGDLQPQIFSGKDRAPQHVSRYPEYMYRLSKLKKPLVRKLIWSHWFEVLQYPKILDNEQVLTELISECQRNKLSREELRQRVLSVNRGLHS